MSATLSRTRARGQGQSSSLIVASKNDPRVDLVESKGARAGNAPRRLQSTRNPFAIQLRPMKSATIPPVRVSAKFRAELDKALENGETLAALVEKAVSSEVLRRKSQAEFVRRGLAAIARTQQAGNGIPADAVIAKLEARLAAARRTHARNATRQAARQE